MCFMTCRILASICNICMKPEFENWFYSFFWMRWSLFLTMCVTSCSRITLRDYLSMGTRQSRRLSVLVSHLLMGIFLSLFPLIRWILFQVVLIKPMWEIMCGCRSEVLSVVIRPSNQLKITFLEVCTTKTLPLPVLHVHIWHLWSLLLR